ncbi:hypothetical protein M9H77_01949 [Catharanthus roseus]|uniref:Uncharacterized protein n=1 Tax=Catharanthus roseus TaxID=4058 RepID=A0ACC0C708_CATRO|nr:hypothetical protein M9H77_01949 [Catharanthus roseus]
MTVRYHVINPTARCASSFLLSYFFPECLISSLFFLIPSPKIYFIPPQNFLFFFLCAATTRRRCLMEEVPAYVHPGPIVLDFLTRQHEHRSGLIWSGDHETCFIDLQCRRFSRNLFQRNDHTYWATQHASHVEVWHQWRLCIKDAPVLAIEVLSYPNDEYIRSYGGITRVHIENPANRDTHSVGYQPAGVDRRIMVHSRVSFFFFFLYSYAFHLFMIDF